jgi:hypothetical protein
VHKLGSGVHVSCKRICSNWTNPVWTEKKRKTTLVVKKSSVIKGRRTDVPALRKLPPPILSQS